MQKTLYIGQMQSGKTTQAVKIFQSWIDTPDLLPIFATFGRRAVLRDLQEKLHLGGVDLSTVLIPNIYKREYSKLVNTLLGDEFPDQTSIIGLHNVYFHRAISDAILHCPGIRTNLFLDEYDTGQVGFSHRDESIKQDNAIHNYIEKGVLNELALISATNLQAAISDFQFDRVVHIQPGEGYNCTPQFEPLYDDDINDLLEGRPNKKIKNRIEETEGHVMFNLDRRISTHEAIAHALQDCGSTHLLNSNENFDLAMLDEPTRQIIIGGEMFARGNTFKGVQSLFFYKPGSHLAVKLQAFGRIFGYKQNTKIYTTQSEYSDLMRMMEVNEKLSDETLLMMPPEDRHRIMEEMSLPLSSEESRSTLLNPRKRNGFTESRKLKFKSQPYMTVDSLPRGLDVTMLHAKHEGITPKKGTRGYTFRAAQSPEHMAKTLIDSHPFQSVHETTVRQFIVPPKAYLYDNINSQNSYYDYCDYEDEHWWIENLYLDADQRRAIKTEYVATYLSTGEIGIWVNTNIHEDFWVGTIRRNKKEKGI